MHAPIVLPTTPLAFHPLAGDFPLMEGTEFDELVADIKKAGQNYEPIALYDGKILDGRNRYRACVAAGIDPRVEVLDDCVDPTAYVISANIRRRHLSPEDKIKYLAKLVAAQPEKSDRTLAKEAGTTHPTIAKARKQAEATGKTLPVEKRTGADGKRRRQPAKKGRGTVLAARAITSGGAAIAAEPAARETSAGRCLCPSCDGAQHTPDVEGVLCAEPNAELALLREFARFVIGRTRVSTDPKDHAEWKALLGKVKVTLGVTP